MISARRWLRLAGTDGGVGKGVSGMQAALAGAPTDKAVVKQLVSEAKELELEGMMSQGVYEPVPYEQAMAESGRAGPRW